MVTAEFSRSVGGSVLDGNYSYRFKYSGEGNPLTQVEGELKKHFRDLDDSVEKI